MGSCYGIPKKETLPAQEVNSSLRGLHVGEFGAPAILLRHLQYRELIPEDFELLSQLDDRVPSRGSLPQNLVDTLPQVQANECNAKSCAICLAEFGQDVCIRRLPCEHFFCRSCIDKWLTQQKGECPICRVPLDDRLLVQAALAVEGNEVDVELVEYSVPETEAHVESQVPREWFREISATRCDGLSNRCGLTL